MSDEWCEGMMLQDFLKEYVKPVVTRMIGQKTPADVDTRFTHNHDTPRRPHHAS